MPRIGGDLDVVQIAADPTTPPSGRSKLYFKSDGLLYYKSPNGAVVQVGAPPASSGGGGRAFSMAMMGA